MAKETKANDFEKEQRIDTVCEFLIKGLTTAQMFRYVSSKTDWGISSRQLDNYISEAKQKIKNSDNDKGFEIQRAKRRLEKLYTKNEDIEEVLKTFQTYEAFDFTIKNRIVTINKPK